jgi:hypothetical protein
LAAVPAVSRMVQFFQPKIAKDISKPYNGIGGNGRLYDPWTSCYASESTRITTTS